MLPDTIKGPIVLLLIVVAGMAIMLGRGQSAQKIFVLVGPLLLFPVLLRAAFDLLPHGAWLILAPIGGFLLLRGIIRGLFGEAVWNESLGHAIARWLGLLWIIATIVVVVAWWSRGLLR